MKDKEQILNETLLHKHEWSNQFTWGIHKAMDAYGADVAIGFATYLQASYYMDNEGFYHHHYNNKIHYTVEQLFEQYKKRNKL